MLRHSKQDILYVFIDSNIANEDYAALDRQALDKFASYANNDFFHFRRSPNDPRYRDLQKIQQYQKITETNKEVLKIELERDSFFLAPERSRIDDLTKILFMKESVTEGEKDLIFWMLLNVDIMSLNKYCQTLFVTDKYGFKASFFIVCGKVATQPYWMNWQDIAQLNKDGMDIEFIP